MYKQVTDVQEQFKQYSGDKNKITQNYNIVNPAYSLCYDYFTIQFL